MKSTTVTTYELDDSNAAVAELVQAVRVSLSLPSGIASDDTSIDNTRIDDTNIDNTRIDDTTVRAASLPLQKSGLGILLTDADADGAALSGGVSKALGIPVAGFTSLATFDPEGYHTGAIVLTVLIADDVVFTAAVSEPLTTDHRQRMIDTYYATVPDNALPGEHPALILSFAPNGESFSGDKYPEIISEVAGGAPIIGGVCSDDDDYSRARVFLSGKEYPDSLVLVSFWGNVRPVFSIRHVTSQFAEHIRRVTRSHDNIVEQVGDEDFITYLETFGLNTQISDPLLAFIAYPLMLTREDEDEVPLMRHILDLDHAEGLGIMVGDVPEDTLANICLIKPDDLKVSARESMTDLIKCVTAVAPDDYRYSTMLCISCCGRSVILGNHPEAEGDVLAKMLPPGLTLSGAYCLGEICPTRYADNVATNRFHNCSFAFCAI
ncbi:MAG: FIST C-terminal domain-containing protein [Coriobacteriales bacterium]|nr:FIST C-terminal domain-containing protein [Coriobacteriales bacterium]